MENSLQSAKTRPGSDCGSGHEPPYWQMQTETEESGENHYTILHYTRYDLNQLPYDYTGEVTNRFKGLDLIDRELDELWTEVCDIVQETGIKTITMEKNCKKAKWLSEEALEITEKRRETKHL